MLTTSYQTRGVSFAFLVGPPKTLTRQDGMAIHSAICDKLGFEDISFRYSTSGDNQPSGGMAFTIELERKQGRGQFKVTIDNAGQQAPVRLFIEYTWPPSREHVNQDIDLAAEAFFEALEGKGWQRVLAETRIRGQTEAKGDSAASFLRTDVLHLSDGEVASLGAPLSYLSLKYETEAAGFTEEDPLAHPKREVSIEVLREDLRCLYVEVMSQWPQLAVSGQGTIEIDARRIRTLASAPSDYLKDSMEYVQSVVLPLFERS